MKRLALVLLAPLLLAAPDAAAQSRAERSGSVRLEAREPARELHVLATRDEEMELVLTADEVFMRFSERTLDVAQREVDRELREEGGLLARLVARSVAGEVLDALTEVRMAVPIEQIERVEWRDGALAFTYRGDPETRFEQVKLDDRPVTEHFDERAARAWIRRFEGVADRK